MSIRFAVGPAGSGKSAYLVNTIVGEAEKHPASTYFFFVPDQFTLSAQKELVAASRGGVTVNIEALSFERFARRVFNELQVSLPVVLDDTGKALLLEKIIRARGDSLSVLSGADRRIGTIDEIKSFLSELRQYNVAIEDLAAAGEDPSLSPAFRKKAADLVLIYSDFQKALGEDFITPEEVLPRLLSCIDRSAMVKNSVFFFDGYTGFTPMQYKVLRKLMTLSPSLTFAFTLGEGENLTGEADEEELFYLTKKSVRKLSDLAGETGTEVEDPVRLSAATNPVRFPAGSRLSHLEKNIFRPEKQKYSPERTGEISSVRSADRGQERGSHDRPAGTVDITELPGPREELTYAACLIRKAVQEEGLRYRDIALLCADLDEYAFLAPDIFTAAGISFFLDRSRDISENPLPAFIGAALAVVRYRFSYEDTVRLLRTGLCGFSQEETDLFDSYLFSSGLTGVTNYRKPFAVLPAGFETEDLAEVNALRARFMASFGPFYDVLKKKSLTVTEALTALFGLFTAFSIEDRLKEEASAFEEAGDEVRAREYGEIYEAVLDAMDRMAELSGEEPTDSTVFGQSMSMALSELAVGTLPQKDDCVVIGDLTRTRLDHIRVLFLLGATDASIPKKVSGGGILSDAEREQLLALTLELAPTARENAFIQKYYLYLALTKPEKALHVFYGRKSADGSPVRPSYLVTELLGLFGQEIFRSITDLPLEAEMICGGGGKRLARALSAYRSGLLGAEEREEMLLLLNVPEAEERPLKKDLLAAAFHSYRPEKIAADVMEQANGPVIIGSVSNLESYAACPYSYFLTYRLRLFDPEGADLSAADIGSLYHAVLKDYLQGLLDEGKDLCRISEGESLSRLETAFAEEVAKMQKAAALDRPSERHAIDNIKKTLVRTVWALRRQAERGSYRPRALEVPLGRAADFSGADWLIDGGKQLKLKGSIDRIDTCEADGRTFVRVIDYKSGKKAIDCTEVYHGLSLQLPTYMGLAVSLVKRETEKAGTQTEVLPGGFLYSQVHDPILTGDLQTGAEALEKMRLSDFRLAGTYTDDPENLRAFDGRIFEGTDEFGTTSPVVSLSLNKDGTPSAIRGEAPTRISSGEMEKVITYVREKEKDFAGAIARGEFPVSPSRTDKKSSCTYCAYRGICGFDSRLPGFEMRHLAKKSLSDITEENPDGGESS